MKRPAFQFYPGDWRGNANLRRCSHAERGVWIEVMCLMHDSEEYGVLRWPLADIAQAAGCKVAELRSLAAKGVLKGSDARGEAFVYTPRHAGQDGSPVTLLPEQDGPVWYSSRMVRDEYVRTKRGIGSRFVESDPAPKPSPKPSIGDGPSSSLFSLQRTPPPPKGGANGAARFDDFWRAYPSSPRKVAKAACEKKWRAKHLDAEADTIVADLKAKSSDRQFLEFTPAPMTYLNQERWRDESQPVGAEEWRKELNFIR